VAFEFRFKAERSRRLWDYAFHGGSLLAAFMQGVIIGTIVGGIAVDGRRFAGGAFDWLSAYSVMTGIALVFGYALLGATWLVMKTDGETQQWARRSAAYVLAWVALFMAMVSVSMPAMDPAVRALWFGWPTVIYLLPVPLITLALFVVTWRDLHREHEYRPFFTSIGIFLTGYFGIGVSLWPYLVPFAVTFRDAAAAPESQSLLLVGTAVMLPVVLAYTAYCYYIFRGKASHENAY
jgi:cytochrome d ubiquinol oxidase subunit II